MKSWLHTHRLRRQRSEGKLPILSHASSDLDNAGPPRPLAIAPDRVKGAARIAASHTSSRMSIERYLSAPLEQEPASVPAINAALRKHKSQSRIPRPLGALLRHSRDSSSEVNSEGRRTFYTSGSAPDSTGTSYSVTSRAAHHQRSDSHTAAPDIPDVPNMPKFDILDLARDMVSSPDRPTTSKTVETEKWTEQEQMEMVMPGYSPDKRIDYKAKAGEEIAQIQQKAKILEDRMRRYKAEREAAIIPSRYITDEMAYERVVEKPKLAWVLGADIEDAQSIKRPKSSGNLALSSADDVPGRPSTETLVEGNSRFTAPRRSKSNGALDEGARQATTEKRHVAVEHRSTKRVRYYCTFCQKRFNGQLEWMRHEQTYHMPEELWVCCPRTGEFPSRCPFCAKSDPSPSHLADHNYLSCQERPLSERTFSHKDFFLQHVSHEHKIGLGEKPARLAELLEAWRHPVPLKQGHQALHCGFCGLDFATYNDRTEHVAGHFQAGLDMMSWWTARISHEIAEPEMSRNPNAPHQCNYCERVYENLATAQKLHPVCTMWSCSFLPGLQYTIYPSGPPTDLEAVCCYCNDTLVRGNGKVKGTVLKEHVAQHNFRKCNQRLYFSGQRFRQHLQDSHNTNYDFTLFAGWALLLKSGRRQRAALFRQTDATSIRRAYTDPSATKTTKQQGKKTEAAVPSMPKMNFMDFSETPNTSTIPRKKLQRKASAPNLGEKREREVRDSSHFFTRAATVDLAYGEASSPSSRLATGTMPPSSISPHHKPGYPVASHPVDAVNTCPRLYRRRLDASTRNRLYIRDEVDGPLSKHSQRLFKKVPASTFGGLVLHSSLVGATPARLTNAVDVYSLH